MTRAGLSGRRPLGKLVTPKYDGLPASFHGTGLSGEGLVAAGHNHPATDVSDTTTPPLAYPNGPMMSSVRPHTRSTLTPNYLLVQVRMGAPPGDLNPVPAD